ncbi:tetratricopeptide repeat protein [Candidatus Atribacteria bacterium 1244-E10-H5-B2]|nr:MAG: tetratricopeptide repeat protein [Candidatus Atribacteria bacterium 1244-E10-H5-B2]
MGTTLILTFARSSYLALGVSMLFMFLLFLLSRGKIFIKENKKIFIFLLIAIILTVSLFIIPTPLNKPGTAISQIKGRITVIPFSQDTNITARIAVWKFTAMMIKDRPILGSGIGTFKYNTLRYQAKFFEQGDNRSIYPYIFADRAHIEHLQLWAELGIIGLAIFLWLMIAYFNYGIRYLKREKNKQKQGIMIGLMGAVLAFLMDSIFWFPLHLPSNLSLFWLFIGLATVMGIKGTEEKKKEKLEAEKINNRQKERSKDKKEKSDNAAYINKNKRSNIYRFKPILYMIIVLLAVFLCVTVFRPFMARIIWHSGLKELGNENWEKATDIYERALKWNPHEGTLHFDLGEIFLMRGLGNTALKSFKEAEKYRDFPSLPQNLAAIYLAKGDLDEAIYEFKRAISYQPNKEAMPLFYVELGNIYLKLGKYEPAEAAFKDALKISPNPVSTQYGLADTYLNQNEIDEESLELKNIIASNLVAIHHRLAEAYLRQNKTEEGLVELKKVIELAPDSEEAKYARDTIQKIEQAKPESQPTKTDN